MRGIVCADVTGDGLKDIAVAAPYAGNIYLFVNQGSRSFGAPRAVETWQGARALAAGDLDVALAGGVHIGQAVQNVEHRVTQFHSATVGSPQHQA